MENKGLLLSSKDFFRQAVSEAFEKRKIKAYPTVQTYIVGMLEHYLDARNLFDHEQRESGQKAPTTLAETLMIAAQSDLVEKRKILKNLGDKSLYVSGFFGDSLSRKLVDIDYYAEVGCSAYGMLSESVKEDTLAKVYKIFSIRFLEFVDVLTYISQQSMIQSDQNILRLYDRYMRTGSELAKEKLVEIGILTVPDEQLKLGRQD